MYYVIDQDDIVYLESDDILDILKQFYGMLDNVVSCHADITELSAWKVKVNWFYPDRKDDILQVIKSNRISSE